MEHVRADLKPPLPDRAKDLTWPGQSARGNIVRWVIAANGPPPNSTGGLEAPNSPDRHVWRDKPIRLWRDGTVLEPFARKVAQKLISPLAKPATLVDV